MVGMAEAMLVKNSWKNKRREIDTEMLCAPVVTQSCRYRILLPTTNLSPVMPPGNQMAAASLVV